MAQLTRRVLIPAIFSAGLISALTGFTSGCYHSFHCCRHPLAVGLPCLFRCTIPFSERLLTARQVRLWAVDRTQSEIVEGMKTSLTGLEYGLAGYWCALGAWVRVCQPCACQLVVWNPTICTADFKPPLPTFSRSHINPRTLDECAGGRARDRFGRHDGQISGCRWIRSDVRRHMASSPLPRALFS